ncbi:hypothetical protein SB49_00320 [Sediminicola sp. YIK13]|uniref:hypothetical protein n=1 Tax=Sediminicola sp. YIK13 TaxID=1453352 RepID=UPI00072265FD|nr:hypothetical protein [Sediminicola sp. YIK13]ALM06427.1 hypothetical protein SB49_00320 [Sediminicola sp. YIK13]
MSFEFRKDSLISNSSLYSEKAIWSISGNQIIINDPDQNNKLDLRISEDKKSFTLQKKGDQDWNIMFKKADSFIDYFQNTQGIHLPTKNDSTLSRTSWQKGFNIYLCKKKSPLNVSTDFSKGIANIKSDFEKFRDNQPPEFYDDLKIFVFADKDLLHNEMVNVIAELNNGNLNPMFRVYKTKIPDYSKAGIYWITEIIK